ncbi:hypothetical protein ACJQWK_03967 [Exserohilum turcicum]|uniref:DUF2264 domain-containing protein n=1 Tax=Exserohilum turcicum (strain 28A) TaxID=671987 RepID=R0J4W7_EXST2|nr:uncharacterized protein SETTUDRAFT_178193 [Exserohilum turcica Et28A]EOA91776.1 hypothetical protein SETTUDRAFT_178193 [Exserohilum turcica Et28A]
MPPLAGFSDNPFATRADCDAAARAILDALTPYQSPAGARIRLPLTTGTHFDDVAAQLEGYARPLWVVGALLHSHALSAADKTRLVDPYARGLASGTNPDHPEYWGPVVLRDQRMVEMEIISFALLAAPDTMFASQTDEARNNITAWLMTLNGKDFPTTNWLWFRVMTNLALIKVCGVPQAEVLDAMKADLDLMEQFYLGEGWAADGIWSDEGRQADYYSGSFAIQFSQLIYAKMARDLDPERCERFQGRARDFAMSFWRYFDSNGAAIPFGRSLTYRFAFAGFWSAVVFADVSLPAPLDDWGVIKGLLLRHFRWWSTKHDMFNVDGTLTIGFAYPNMFLSEDYNSPQSPYWATKALLALAMPESHPFWLAEEKPLPHTGNAVVPVRPPMHILCQQRNHHFLLSTGQFCPWPLKATEAKYGKYAYSSHFGFSVPTGPLIQQMAPDSTLALSKDGGDTWRVPWKVSAPAFHNNNDNDILAIKLVRDGQIAESISAMSSSWKPWADADVVVRTLLIAPCSRWPDWYIRWHTIWNPAPHTVKLHAVQGGFAIQGRGHSRGEVLPAFSHVSQLKAAAHNKPHPEGTVVVHEDAAASTLICSDAGASGIRALHLRRGENGQRPVEERAEVLKPDANTNLIWQRTLIPTLHAQATADAEPVQFGSAVFALARTDDRADAYAALDTESLWMDMPVIATAKEEPGTKGWYISIPDANSWRP